MISDRRIVQSPLLGKLGRFANWIIQYSWSLDYAQHCDAILQTHPWIGETIFEINHERITEELPVTKATDLPYCMLGKIAIPMFYEVPGPHVGRATTREKLHQLKWRSEYDPTKVPQKNVVVHWRRGDFAVPAEGWPIVGMNELMDAVAKTGVDPKECEIVSDEFPSKNNVYPKSMDFLYDFQVILRAKTVFAYPCSTFSLIAGMMGYGDIFKPINFSRGTTTCEFVRY